MKHSGRVFAVLVPALLCLASAAQAHGDLQSSDPAAGAEVQKTPRSISLTLTEPPGPGTTVRVVDGCRRNVAAAVKRSGSVVDVELADPQPGKWTVRYRSVSSVDGHAVKGSYRFAVKGQRGSCTRKSSVEDEVAGGEDTRIEPEDVEDTGSFPVIPFAIGSVVVIALAFILRRATR